ncbi:hypothetical protein PTSG_06712 [Salpingoeca rosetta]|uniref:Uncharacterized protein n=1 Tax=Salpingoeca rosetta (strain ATCC 50818 / BSB-021) TaxID=946362 RepID=F2UEK5_SALR5|nr:uncharacterized protein PTSG_06712 [Salpingoeca rosetta]EGD75055.1 hypothetical protein PTSG_06712 [Salpingoeca rosetta]|eukprot:XP_004992108.1 hypothetical protein PTSG_06712 [Salpingoeca rosetta]
MDAVIKHSKPAQEARQVYLDVVDQVIANVKAAFLDEGSDEQVLEDLRSLWLANLYEQRTIDTGLHQVDGAGDDGDDDDDDDDGNDGGQPTPAQEQPQPQPQQPDASGSEPRDTPETQTSTASTGGQPPAPAEQEQPSRNDESVSIDDDDDDDDEDDDDDDDEEMGARPNHIICQHERINHSKNVWKAALRNCVVHVDGQDFVFGAMKLDYIW